MAGLTPASREDGVLSILHFNDVYEVEGQEREPVGGLARFVHAINRVRAHASSLGPVLTFFSGDALSPSLLATFTKGKHMIRALNLCGISAACLGNHDLDFGVDNFASVSKQHTFPWIVSNCTALVTGAPLGGCQPFHVIEAGHWKVGVLGLIEQEWLATLATLDSSSVAYEDYIACASRLVPHLRGELGCNFIVALTHMRLPNDRRLALASTGIDVILGGHDHDYVVDLGQSTAATPIVKSGSDFRDFTWITVSNGALGPSPVGGTTVGSRCMLESRVLQATHFEITRAEPQDDAALAYVNDCKALMGKKMDRVLGVTSVPLDAIFSHVRTRETNAGNFLADLSRVAVGADIGILNGGTLRANADIGPGIFRMRDLVALLPMQDPIVKLQMPGEIVLDALENSVSKWPAAEGRFAQVSGIRFAFDATKPPGSRVMRESVQVLRESHAAAVAATSSHAVPPLGDDRDGAGAVEAVLSHLPPHTHVDVIAAHGSHGRLLRADSAPAIIANSPCTVEHVTTASPVAPSPVESSSSVWGPLDAKATYTVATKAYLANGKDGYTCFVDPRVTILVDAEQGPVLPGLVRLHFRMLSKLAKAIASGVPLDPFSPLRCARGKPPLPHIASSTGLETLSRGHLLGAHTIVSRVDHLDGPDARKPALSASFAIAPALEARITEVSGST